jgi:hypothetical protein
MPDTACKMNADEDQDMANENPPTSAVSNVEKTLLEYNWVPFSKQGQKHFNPGHEYRIVPTDGDARSVFITHITHSAISVDIAGVGIVGMDFKDLADGPDEKGEAWQQSDPNGPKHYFPCKLFIRSNC